MSKGNRNRQLRLLAEVESTEYPATTNDNIQVKQLVTNNYVMNDDGAMVKEVVPNTTYTTKHKEGTARALYQQMKKGSG